MATKEELTRGIEQLIQESRRLANDVRAEDWEQVVDLDGWKSQEVLAHIAGTGGLIQPLVGGVVSAEPGTNAFANINIDQINAGVVAARAGKTPQELADEVETAYRGAIGFINGMEDDVLAKKVTVAGYVDVPLSDIMVRMVVLHGLAHIYSVYSSIMNRGM
jgi:hypothetical protein